MLEDRRFDGAVVAGVAVRVDWGTFFDDMQAMIDDGVEPIEAAASLPVGKYLQLSIATSCKMESPNK